MKKLIFLLFALNLGASLIFYSCSKDTPVSSFITTPTNLDSTGVVSGIVKDINGLPIKSVSISCESTIGYYYSTVSDSLGNFKIKNIKPGNYSMLFLKNGYISDTIIFSLQFKDSLSYTVQLNATFWFKLNSSANPISSYTGYNGLYINPSNVLFITTKVGSAILNQSAMMKSSNYGLNWSNAISANAISGIYKLTNSNLFVFSEKWQDGQGNYMGENKLFKSFDYANTWNSIKDFNFDHVMNRSISYLNSTYFLSIVGVNYPNPNIVYLFYKSDDQGNTWNSFNPVSNYKINFVSRTSSSKIFIQNNSDTMYYSIDGTTWNIRITSNTNYRSCLRNSIILPNGKMIANVGDYYYLSNDDGESFVQINSNINSNLPYADKFAFNSNNDIYCYFPGDNYGTSGCVYKSSDNCVTLIKCEEGLPHNYFVSGLYIVDDYAYLICNGFVYRTTKKTTENNYKVKTNESNKLL